MPSALEKLVKILRLEQETGYKNTAVIGGLQSFVAHWVPEAHRQAKTEAHHALVEELANVINHYTALDDRESRYNTVRYMLGRITGRADPWPEFVVEWTAEDTARLQADLAEAHTSGDAPAERAGREPPARQPAPRVKAKDEDETVDDVGDDDIDDDEDFTPEDDISEEDLIDQHFDLVGLAVSDVYVPVSKERAPKPRPKPRESLMAVEALAHWRRLDDDIRDLKGVGKRRGIQLNTLGIKSVGDLIFAFPRRYDDYTKVLPLGKIVPMERVTAVGFIKEYTERVTRDGRRYLRVVLEDETGRLPVTFFGQTYLKRHFRPGMKLAVYGKVDLYLGQPQMANPEWEELEDESLISGEIVPVYPLTKGLSNKVLRNLIRQALDDYAQDLPDYMPRSVLERTELVDLDWALEQVHFPERSEYLEYAQERLAFDELMLLQLGVLAKRHEWQSVPGIPLPVGEDWLETASATLPYTLTGAQQRALAAIRQDVGQGVPMNRLLQGDVGSGKTAVAALALGMAVANGKQAAIMAPTSILAEQHLHSIGQMLADLPGGEDVEIRLLTSAVTGSARDEIYRGLAEGTVDVVVGTHALIQEQVTFKELALAVIDEQHRFGVDERGSLRGKGTNPHVLVMTATPIPRTLALTIFADLDLTVLDEMPPGRTPIKTRVLDPAEREQTYKFIRKQLDEGRQAYIVYPLIEESENIQARAAVNAYDELSQSDFYGYNIGLLHGRISPTEKDEIMAAFANHELDVLVSTSVIEVGINVPNATVILIEGANRFGLAQLHQLRGRVGRGEHPSYCFLLGDTNSFEARKRLKALEETTDGFELAELDWEMRGAGELLGTRQAGVGSVDMANMMNTTLVEMAQMESRALFAEDPLLRQPEHQLLASRVATLRQRTTDFS